VISGEEVNTLDHLGFEYKWSKYSPSKKSEILEAERAKDELRDIMSRMIGAEIRYTQMGYWMRQPPYGFVSKKVETKNGKRCVLKPHPTESKYMTMIFEMRAQRIRDEDIIARLTDLGCRTRVRYKRDKHDRTKIVSKSGGDPLTIKGLGKLIRNPIYAGINAEKWTGGKPIRCAFKGLVSVELFNKANRGKRVIVEGSGDDVQVCTEKPAAHLIEKGRRNPDFPYRKFILCPECGNPLGGSATRGRNGTYYPAYHCSKHGHYYRIPKQELEDTVAAFVSNLIVPEERIQAVVDAIAAEWNLRNQGQLEEIQGIADRITELQKDFDATMDKIRVLTSPTTIKFMEEDLMKIEQQIKTLAAEKAKKEAQRPADLNRILGRARHFAENLEQLLIKQIDPIKKARLFAAIFDRTPTYAELESRNTKTPLFTGVNAFFQLLKNENALMVTLPHPLFNSIVAEVVRWNDVIRNVSVQPNPLKASWAV